MLAFRPKGAPLNRAASKFGSTVLEGFCDLSKILETSTSHIDKVHVPEITGPSVAGAQTNRLSKLASQFLPRSRVAWTVGKKWVFIAPRMFFELANNPARLLECDPAGC